MVSKAKTVTLKSSLPCSGSLDLSAFRNAPAVIPADHSARLIVLGYMVDLEGRLRMTTQRRIRIYAGQLANWGGLTSADVVRQ
jgi:hypothetical protein